MQPRPLKKYEKDMADKILKLCEKKNSYDIIIKLFGLFHAFNSLSPVNSSPYRHKNINLEPAFFQALRHVNADKEVYGNVKTSTREYMSILKALGINESVKK